MTRWQKPYLDVPADDYLTSESYICKIGLDTNYIPRLNELIGPHERRCMNLMRNGRKPLSLIDDWELPFWEQEIKTRGYGMLKASDDEYIIYLPGLENRANILKRVIEKYDLTRKSKFYHVKLGYLLGYTKSCILAFGIRMNYIIGGQMDLADSTIFESVEAFEQAFPMEALEENDDVGGRMD